MYLRYLKLPTPETNNIRDLRARYLFGERLEARDILLRELQNYKNTYGVLPNIPGINNVIRDTELEDIGIEDDGELQVSTDKYNAGEETRPSRAENEAITDKIINKVTEMINKDISPHQAAKKLSKKSKGLFGKKMTANAIYQRWYRKR